MIAVRTACSASSGRTTSAGGGCRPIRCRAARTSTMTARRCCSDVWNNLLPFVERLEPRLRRIDARLDVADVSGTVDELLIERRAIGVDRLDFALEFDLRVQRRPLLGTGRVEFLIVLPEHVGCRLCRCGRGMTERRRSARAAREIERKRPNWLRTAAQKPKPSQAQGMDRCDSTVGESSYSRVDPSLRKARKSSKIRPE